MMRADGCEVSTSTVERALRRRGLLPPSGFRADRRSWARLRKRVFRDPPRQLLTDAEFPVWAHIMAAVIGDRDCLARRLREWTLLRTIALDEPWAAEALTAASDWFQRIAATAQIITSADALSLLAEQGRTRHVRNAASRRMEQLDQPPN